MKTRKKQHNKNKHHKHVAPCMKKQTKSKTIKLGCSPNVTHDKDFTCYNSNSLIKLRDLWNGRHPDLLIESKDDREIWKSLKIYMSDVCKTEKCWLKQNFASNNLTDELKNYTFVPDAPKKWKGNKNEWLNSLDIERVMKQYEKKHNNFDFLGPSPIDFNKKLSDNTCVWDELCNFDLKENLLKNKTKIGIIFNTDPHYLGGSHWISMFIDINKKFILFFDSTGDDVPKEIKQFIKKIKKQGNDIGKKFKVYINKKKHQMGNSECGMYSLHTIIGLLDNEHDVNFFLNNDIPDKNMEKLRQIYFN
jgi:hypothetical protein